MSEIVTLTKPPIPAGPLSITSEALARLIYAKKTEKDLSENSFIRVALKGGGCSGFMQALDFDDELDPEEDVVYELILGEDQVKVVIDVFSEIYLEGTELDFVKEGFTEGFKFNDTLGKVKKTCGCGKSVAY